MTTVGRPRAGKHRAGSRVTGRDARRDDAGHATEFPAGQFRLAPYADAAPIGPADRPPARSVDERLHRVPPRRNPPPEGYRPESYRQADDHQPDPVRALPRPKSRLLARAKHLLLVSAGAVVLIAVVALALGVHVAHLSTGSTRLAFGWPGMRFLIYAVWMVPVAELILLVLGQLNSRYRFRTAVPGSFTEMIIQITTTGGEQQRVNEIIELTRGYRLAMRHQIWVVTEPGQRDQYPLADRVLIVPADFIARSERKARALEYSRRVRVSLGLDRPDIKILFNDDDVAPTKGYIEKAFVADYDICEGVTSPRSEYAVRPLSHFLASHADDMRTHGCLVYCSVFQGILGRPLHVHGEGLTVTGAAEGAVTWDWPAFASEDLVFGQRAARAGLRWGWFHEYVELTSPWTLRDFITQRRRWLWGDIHGILHRDVLSLPGATLVALKYLFGLIAAAFSVAGLILRLTGELAGQSSIYDVTKLSIIVWLAVFFACGWIGASSRVSSRSNDSRLLQAATAVLMLPVSSLLTLAGVLIPLVQGNPRTFQVIRKTRQGSR
jgi:Glycosyl transferase family group 2